MSTLVQQRTRLKHNFEKTSCRVCDEIFRKTKTVLFFVTNEEYLWDIQIKCVSDHFTIKSGAPNDRMFPNTTEMCPWLPNYKLRQV